MRCDTPHVYEVLLCSQKKNSLIESSKSNKVSREILTTEPRGCRLAASNAGTTTVNEEGFLVAVLKAKKINLCCLAYNNPKCTTTVYLYSR